MKNCFFVFVCLWFIGCSEPDKEASDQPLAHSYIEMKTEGEVANAKEEMLEEYTRTRTIKDIEYQVSFKPLGEIQSDPMTKETPLEELKTQHFFSLKIAINAYNKEFLKHNLTSVEEYQERINYCAFNMQKDIFLVDGVDTLKCLMYHFERTFDITPYGTFMLSFENKTPSITKPKTLVFNDNLFGNGVLKFFFSPKSLFKEPMLLM